MIDALRSTALRGPGAAIPLMLLAMLVLPLMDGIAKHLGARMPPEQVAWGRYAFNLLLVLPVALPRYRSRLLLPPRPIAQLVRALLLVLATAAYFQAIALIPLADALALGFVYPLLVTLAAPWLLGERVGPVRVGAALVGFLGALVIIRPGLGVMQPAALLALSTSVIYAGYVLMTRRLAGTVEPLLMLAFTAVVNTALLSALVPWRWVAPTPSEWLLLAGLGLFGGLGHLLLITAFERGDASKLAPLSYVEIIGAVAIGWAMFGDWPDLWTWVGIVVIVASGLVIALRERPASG